MRVFLDDKEKYRRRYYLGIDEPGNKYLLFGSEFAKGLEDGSIKMPSLPQYAVSEKSIKTDIDGVPFFAYLDSYDPELHKFREYKTGIRRQNGSARWTQELVNEHMQLDVYSLLIDAAFGSVDDECHLDWIVTRPKVVTTLFDGHVLEAEGRELEFTGEVVSFRRVISKTERDRMRILVRSVAEEISADYAAFLEKAAAMPELMGAR